MDKHYGFINFISKNASKLPEEDLAKVFQALGIEGPEDYELFGGHEFLAVHPHFDAKTLDDLWFTKKSVKIRSGFYAQQYEIEGKNTVLLNAFHPVQLEHYTKSSHKTLVLLCRTDMDWAVMREQVAGDTFPEKAVRDSIRGELFAEKDMYGLEEVSIAYNGVHMSAGPFEAAFEIDNFLKSSEEAGYSPEFTNLHYKMKTQGFSDAEIAASILNPKKDLDGSGKEVSLFDKTEGMNTFNAIRIFEEIYR